MKWNSMTKHTQKKGELSNTWENKYILNQCVVAQSIVKGWIYIKTKYNIWETDQWHINRIKHFGRSLVATNMDSTGGFIAVLF